MPQSLGFVALCLVAVVSVGLVESAAKDCFFGPPPKPEAGNPDPHHWMKQVMEQVRKNCPGRQPTTNGVSTTPVVCPSTWIQWGGNCYKFTGRVLNWADARKECVQMGGTMVAPQSEIETQFLLDSVIYVADYIWINCNDNRVDGQWECEGETEVTSTEMPWKDGQPDGTNNENCGAMSVTNNPVGKWWDLMCDLERYTVCKQPL